MLTDLLRLIDRYKKEVTVLEKVHIGVQSESVYYEQRSKIDTLNAVIADLEALIGAQHDQRR